MDLGRGPDAHFRLGEILLQGRYVALAADHLARASEAYPQDLRLRQALAAARALQTTR